MPVKPIAAIVEVLRRDSQAGRGSSPAIPYLMDLLYYGDFNIFEQVATGGGQDSVNLIGARGPATGEPLWLVAYLATGREPTPPPVIVEDGEVKPLLPRIDRQAGMIYGLGAASGKADGILKVIAASAVPRAELKRPIHVVLLFGEEARTTGIRHVLASGASPAAAFFSAPTNLELWTHHPGVVGLQLEVSRRVRHRRMPPTRGIFEIEIPGRSAHAQTPGLGVSALDRALKMLDRLREPGDIRILVFDCGESANRVPGTALLRVATSYDELPPLPDDVKAKPLDDGVSLPFPIDRMLDAWLTGCEAGRAAISGLLRASDNATAARPRPDSHIGWLANGRDAVVGTLAVWTGPEVDTRELGETFANAVQQSLVGRDEMEVAIRVVQDRPALTQAQDPALLQIARGALSDTGLPPVISGGRYTTDAALVHPSPGLAFGPGQGIGSLYRAEEGVPLDHVDTAHAFYGNLIRRYCVDV